jgi:hypothetical protein
MSFDFGLRGLLRAALGRSRSKEAAAVPIALEVPTPWLQASTDGQMHRLMFATLGQALGRMRLTVSLSETRLGLENLARSAPKGGILLSYHSIGDVPNVWRIKESAIPNYYLFDRCGYSGWAEIAKNPDRFSAEIEAQDVEEARCFVSELRAQLVKSNLSKYRQSKEAFDVDEPFVFFPLQKRADTVARLYRIDSLAVLQRASEVAAQRRKLLVIKRHPLCREQKMAETIERLAAENPYVRQTTASVHRVLERCDSVLVANSGVGFEALLHERPVYSFGASEYESATATLQRLDDIERAFSDQHQVDSRYRDQFVSWFLKDYCFSSLDLGSVIRKLKLATDECRQNH